MRRVTTFIAAIVATVAMQMTLSPAATASPNRATETISTVTGTVANGDSADAVAGWLHWDNYFSLDYCQWMGAIGKLAKAWQTYYCAHEPWVIKPWALYVYL